MMTDSVARVGSSKTITREDIRELGEELLNLRWSSEERGTVKGRLRRWRDVENNGLRALGIDHLVPLDVNEEVKVFQEISSKEGN